MVESVVAPPASPLRWGEHNGCPIRELQAPTDLLG